MVTWKASFVANSEFDAMVSLTEDLAEKVDREVSSIVNSIVAAVSETDFPRHIG